MKPIRIGAVGYGYWGPKLVRNFTQLPEFEVAGVADLDPARLAQAGADFGIETTTTDLDELLRDPSIDAVAIATPISTHEELAARALEAGKHVWLEKPMAHSVEACDRLVRLARDRERVLLVDHTFLYTGAVEKMGELIRSGQLGDLYYFDSVRVNLGLFQHDYNVVWDLAPHDLSILLHLIDDTPLTVQATGAAPAGTGTRLESVAYVTIHFASGLIGHCHVNWLAPKKIRLMQIAGAKQMLVWDDVEPDTKVRVYDSGVDIPESAEAKYQTMVQYRTGDMWAPQLDKTEALRKEAQHFATCVRSGEAPRSDGNLGRDVVALLEAAQRSIDSGGVPVHLVDGPQTLAPAPSRTAASTRRRHGAA